MSSSSATTVVTRSRAARRENSPGRWRASARPNTLTPSRRSASMRMGAVSAAGPSAQATVEEAGHRRRMREGAADDFAPRHHRGEARDMGMRPPPVTAELERHARAQEEHPSPGRPAEQVPEGLQPVAANDLVRGRPVAWPRPQRDRGLVRAGRRAGEEDARREPQHRRDPRRGPGRIPPIARDARAHEPRERGGAAQDQGEQAPVHEPVGGKPEHDPPAHPARHRPRSRGRARAPAPAARGDGATDGCRTPGPPRPRRSTAEEDQ